MIDHDSFSIENVLYKLDKKSNNNAIKLTQPMVERIMPKTSLCKTNFIDVDMDIAILREDLVKNKVDRKSQHERKEFVINYAEGIRNLDMANYSVAVACFEKALRYKPEDHTTQEYLLTALRGELNDTSRRMSSIRDRLEKLSRSENHCRVRKCTVKMPVFAGSEHVPQGLLDSNGLIKHFSQNAL